MVEILGFLPMALELPFELGTQGGKPKNLLCKRGCSLSRHEDKGAFEHPWVAPGMSPSHLLGFCF